MASSKPVIHGRDHLPGGADPIPLNFGSAAEGVTFPTTAVDPTTLTNLEWVHNTGSTLLDYTTPDAPVVLKNGVYAVSLSVVFDFGMVGAATDLAWFEINLYGVQAFTGTMHFAQILANNSVLVGVPKDLSIAGTFLMDAVAGDNFQFAFYHTDVSPVNIQSSFVEVVRIIELP